MSQTNYSAPAPMKESFTCPHRECGVISRHGWDRRDIRLSGIQVHQDAELLFAWCDHCKRISIWVGDEMVYPETLLAPEPNSDLPESVLTTYLEAARVSDKSPRGAAALLRLSIQQICVELEEKGKNLNADIKNLVKKGLPVTVQKALDIVRVTGNNAVHPGQIDVDDPIVANRLFGLVNIIADYMITMPNRINEYYEELPDSALEQIEERDNSQ